MHTFEKSRVAAVSVAAMLIVTLSVVDGVHRATRADALDLTRIAPIVAVTEGPDAEQPVIGYTLATPDSQETCELLRIDWVTGLTVDLPSTPTADACVTDLAVAPDGTVYGIKAIAPPEPVGVTCASSFCGPPLARLVTFAADGTATSIEIGPATLNYEFSLDLLGVFRGVAVDSAGVIHVTINNLWVDVTDCSPAPSPVPGSTSGASPAVTVADGIYDWSACLFTVDPTTGDMTLVGPSKLPGNFLAGLSIGSEGGRTLAFLIAPSSVAPSSIDAAYWGAVDLATGEVTPTGSTYPTSNGMFDQLRSQSIIYALVEDPATGTYRTATVDPLTGAIISINDLRTELPPRPEPVAPAFTG